MVNFDQPERDLGYNHYPMPVFGEWFMMMMLRKALHPMQLPGTVFQ
jgi:hypothetical protein